jgi:TonB-linked SusC/RagA family outer membrane protein
MRNSDLLKSTYFKTHVGLTNRKKLFMSKIYKFYGILGMLMTIAMLLGAGSQQAYGQNLTVTGNVKDDSGGALPGVSVLVKGTKTGTITNTDGDFSINTAAGTVLTFSFVGYETKEVKVTDAEKLNISLSANANVLNDVVVVGYSSQKKSSVTNAITKVTAKEISASPSAHLGAGLAGRIAGVTISARGGEPGAEQVEVFIRGKSTTGDANPLYVIDGIVRDYSGFSYLNPNEIESISILKDASAAIYGARAANGVILITTKRGTLGKSVVTVDYDHALSQQMRIPESADAFTFASMANLEQRIKGQPQPYTAQDLELYKNGSDPLNHPNTKWSDLIFKQFSLQDRADVSVTGGSKDTKYFVSAGYLSANSPFKESYTGNRQYSFRSNIDFDVNKDLKLALDVSGRRREVVNSKFDWAHIYLGVPTLNGIYPNGLVGPGRTGNNAVLMARDRNYGFNDTKNNTFFGTLSGDYKIPGVDGLSLQGNFAFDTDDSYNKNWTGVTYYYVLNQTTGEYVKTQNSNAAQPSLGVSSPKSYALTTNTKVSYNKTFAKKHTIDAFVGYEQNSSTAYNLYAQRTNYNSGALEEIFAGSSNKQNQSNDGSSNMTGRQNFFGRALYGFDNRYNIQFQFRYDGSQNFPPGKRYGFFPGVSGNWIVSNESFMKNVNFVDNLKLRASYGELGNDKVGAYQYLTSYGYGSNYVFNGNTAQGLVQSGAPNPNITWEVARTTDIGLEFGLLKGLLSAEVDYFYTKRSNILATRNASVPEYTGLSLPNENIGSVKNQGFEVSLTHSKKLTEDFRYSISGNFTYAKSTIIFRDELPSLPEWQRSEGKPVGSQLLYEAIGVFRDAAQVAATPARRPGSGPGDLIIRDVNNDGVINSLDRVYQKYGTTPQIVYGLNFRFNYKAFELFLGFQGQANSMGQRFNPYPFDPIAWGDFPTYLSQDVWSPENPGGTKPKPGVSDALPLAGTTYNWESTAFLKLKTAELSYTLPASVLSKAGVRKTRVYLSGSNLFFITDKFKPYNLDPELTNAGWGYSQNRIINIGASLSF